MATRLALRRDDPSGWPIAYGAPMLVVYGMHRSGTSVVAGMIAEQGVFAGDVSSSGLMNPDGTRELPALTALHNQLLARVGARWWRPPAAPPRASSTERSQLDEVIAPLLAREPALVKDPRMLIVGDLWDRVDLQPIGVIRDPVAVARSLQARRRARGGEMPIHRGLRLWAAYNLELLRRWEKSPFPLLDFDRPNGLETGLNAALAVYSIPTGRPYRFFRPDQPASSSPPRADQESPKVPAEIAELSATLKAVADRGVRQ